MSKGQSPFWPRPRPPRIVLVSDLDHTMVQNEDPRHLRQLTFDAVWQCAASPAHDSLLVYSTGRSPSLYRKLWEEAPLLTPDVLICSVGSEIFYLTHSAAAAAEGAADPEPRTTMPTAGATPAPPQGHGGNVDRLAGHRSAPHYEPDSEWEALLDQGWDRERVLEVAARFPRLRRQVDSEQRRHKVSFHLEEGLGWDVEAEGGGQDGDAAAARKARGPSGVRDVLCELQEALSAEHLRVKVVYSGGRDVDLLAEGAGKGAALHFLLERLRATGSYPTAGVQVNGDSGNDIELFQVPGVRGCVVANAFPELMDFARRAAGAAKAAAIKAVEAGGCGGNSAPSEAPECDIFQATQPCAGGILEAMRHFNLLPYGCFPAGVIGGAAPGAAPGGGGRRPEEAEAPAPQPEGQAATASAMTPSLPTKPTEPNGAEVETKAREALPALTHVVAAAHKTLSLLMAPLTTGAMATAAEAGAQDAGQPSATEVAAKDDEGAGADTDTGASSGRDVAAAAASAAAAGVWLDRLEVTSATAEAAAAVPGRGGGNGGGGKTEGWLVHCQAFQLLPNGHRNLSSMTHVSLTVRCESEPGSGGVEVAQYTASVRSAEAIGMGDVTLPPLNI